jgi:hypothetical protein
LTVHNRCSCTHPERWGPPARVQWYP